MIDVRFRNELDSQQIGDAMAVLARPRLYIPTATDYPRHPEWLEKTEAQIVSGEKQTLLGYVGREPVGAVVYRPCALQPNIVEIRNISIDPSVRGSYFGAFMLRQVENEAVSEGSDTFTVDTKLGNAEMIGFLESQGYQITDIADLYHDSTGEDVILTKSLAL